jgi:hypothetical protein
LRIILAAKRTVFILFIDENMVQRTENDVAKVKRVQTYGYTAGNISVRLAVCADLNVQYGLFSQHAPWACRSPRINPPAAAAAATVEPFYSSFDWLDYGLILLVNPT